jgi:hypothetical protein
LNEKFSQELKVRDRKIEELQNCIDDQQASARLNQKQRYARRTDMRPSRYFIAISVIVLLVAAGQAQTTAFTYQGRLNNSSMPANGNYDMTFDLHSAQTGGVPIASQTIVDVPVTNGIFTVQLDFGGAAFSGGDRWLEIIVEGTLLSPRQKIASAPYAIRSSTASTATNAEQLGGVAASSYLQTNGDGSGLTNLNASSVNTGTLNDARLSSNVALENAPNTFTADQTINANLIQSGATADLFLTNGFLARGSFGAGTIPVSGAGTRMMFYPRKAAFRAGRVFGNQWDDANIGEDSTATGVNTRASGFYSVAMGNATTASGTASIALGESTSATANYATAIGSGNTASGVGSFVVGQSSTASNPGAVSMGFNTTASGIHSTAIGHFTTASGSYSTALGLYASTNNFNGSFVYGDSSTAGSAALVSATAPNQFVARATGGFRFRTAANLSSGCDISSGSLSCTGSVSSAGATLTGNVSISGNLTVGGGSTITSVRTATATLDFPFTSPGTGSDLTIAVAGAQDGDAVSLGVPNISIVPSGFYTAWVSAPDTVTVRLLKIGPGGADPAPGTFRVMVTRF